MAQPSNPRFTLRIPGGGSFGPADLATMARWAREGRVPPHALLSEHPDGPPVRADQHAALRPYVRTPPQVHGAAERRGSALIPTRNPPALIAYYAGIAALIPGPSVLAGPTALTLGVIGLRRARRDPGVHGATHAWIGIVLGTLGSLVSIVVLVGWLLFALP